MSDVMAAVSGITTPRTTYRGEPPPARRLTTLRARFVQMDANFAQVRNVDLDCEQSMHHFARQ